MTNIEVDQSGKMGDLRVNTVLAFSNDLSRAILVPAQVKRALVQKLRDQGKSRTRAAIQLFAAGLFLLLNCLWQTDPTFEKERLIFHRIGKGSPAHKLAIEVYRGRRKADKQVSVSDLLMILGK